MNRHTVRLWFAIIFVWMLGGLADTPLVPYRHYVVIFFLIIFLPIPIILLPHQGPKDEVRPKAGRFKFVAPSGTGIVIVALGIFEIVVAAFEGWQAVLFAFALVTATVAPFLLPIKSVGPLGDHFRIGWLIASLTTAALAAILNMFMFASVVMQLDGERIQATLRDGGSTECVLARPDGSRIPGALRVDNGCQQHEDVFASKHGLADPIRAKSSVDGALLAAGILLAIPLTLGVIAAWWRPSDT